MKKIYYLKTCSTCQRILKELPTTMPFELQDIKTNPITSEQLKQLQQLAGSYESLFSRRAMLYKERGLKNQELTELDYKNLILDHYTFLNRPVFVIDNTIFIGSSPKNIEHLHNFISNYEE